jgi:hypothetical protein
MAREFRDRWEDVRAIEIEEQRNATIEQRWRQINAMHQMSKALGRQPTEEDEEFAAVRERWAWLRKGKP